ncbi:MAG: biotin/lipoyl-containing protein [Stellaceae bacterium]
MTTEIRVPSLGESVTEATVARWLKQPGDLVARDEPLAELETDKATLELPSPAAGVLAEILAPEGAEVPIGAVLGRITEGAVAAAAAPEASHPLAPEARAPPSPRAGRGSG